MAYETVNYCSSDSAKYSACINNSDLAASSVKMIQNVDLLMEHSDI